MHIGYLVSRYPSRSHTFIRREIETLRELGCTISVFSLRRCDVEELKSDSDHADYEETWSIFPIGSWCFLRTHLSNILRSPRHYFKVLLFSLSLAGGGISSKIYSLAYFLEAIYLSSELKKKNITVVHAHFANAGGKVAAIAAKFLNLPWILSVHGNSDFGFPSSQWLMTMVQDARVTRCVSAYGASQIRRNLPIDNHGKVIVSYCGLPGYFSNATRKDLSIQPEIMKLLVVGRLSSEKGQLFMLEVVRRLLEKKIPVHLELIGSGPDLNAIESFIRLHEMKNAVTLHGAVEEHQVLKYMVSADVLVCPSYMEGLPQVLMEAMLVELPVVAPYLAGIPELVENRVNGMLFPAGDFEALEGTIIELNEQFEMRRELAHSGRETVLNKFMIDKSISSLHRSICAVN